MGDKMFYIDKIDEDKIENKKGTKKLLKANKKKQAETTPDFLLHGLDYLPDFEKRREKRKKNVPKFLRIEGWNWASTYLTIFGQTILNRPSKYSDNCDMSPSTDGTFNEHLDHIIHTSSTIDSLLSDVNEDWKIFNDYPFRNLVMSGGGSKGYAFIGALKALEDCGILSKVTHIAGSSAGAICAGLLGVNCTPQDIANVFKCDIKWLFHDQSCACCCCLPHVCRKYGVHPAKRFYEIYGEHIAKKTGNKDITFKEVRDRFGKELTIVVTNLSRMCSEYCNSTTSPDLPIRKAVRMSMGFPVVFRAMRENITGTECVYTDGGLLDQYPIRCFDDTETEQEVNHNNEPFIGMKTDCNMRTIGLYVVSERPIDYKIWQTLFGKEIPYKPTYLPNTKLARERLKHEMSHRKRQIKDFSKKEYMDELRASVGDKAVDVWDHYEIHNKSHVDINNFGEYFVTTIETLLISQRKIHVKPSDFMRTVAINCGYIGTNDYIIEAGDREFMINQGFVCTGKYLNGMIKQLNGELTTSINANDITVPNTQSANNLEHIIFDITQVNKTSVGELKEEGQEDNTKHPSLSLTEDALSFKSAQTSPYIDPNMNTPPRLFYPADNVPVVANIIHSPSKLFYSTVNMPYTVASNCTTANHSYNSLYTALSGVSRVEGSEKEERRLLGNGSVRENGFKKLSLLTMENIKVDETSV